MSFRRSVEIFRLAWVAHDAPPTFQRVRLLTLPNSGTWSYQQCTLNGRIVAMVYNQSIIVWDWKDDTWVSIAPDWIEHSFFDTVSSTNLFHTCISMPNLFLPLLKRSFDYWVQGPYLFIILIAASGSVIHRVPLPELHTRNEALPSVVVPERQSLRSWALPKLHKPPHRDTTTKLTSQRITHYNAWREPREDQRGHPRFCALVLRSEIMHEGKQELTEPRLAVIITHAEENKAPQAILHPNADRVLLSEIIVGRPYSSKQTVIHRAQFNLFNSPHHIILPLTPTTLLGVSSAYGSPTVIALPLIQKGKPTSIWSHSEYAMKTYQIPLQCLVGIQTEMRSADITMCPLSGVIEVVRTRNRNREIAVKLEVYMFD